MRKLGIKVIWFSKERYSSGDVLRMHNHSYFHYIYAVNGRARFFVGFQSFQIGPGDFMLTPIGIDHGMDQIEAKGIDVIEVKFHVTDPELLERVMALEGRLASSDQQILRILEGMIGEGVRKEQFYEELVNLKFLEVLYYLRRGGEQPHAARPPAMELSQQVNDEVPGISDFRIVLQYIEANLKEAIRLETLAKMCHVSKHHFCRNFKQALGVSPMRYLSEKRLSRAKQHMLHSDLNVTQIAYLVGFSDIHYFSKFFKKHEHLTPQEFIAKMKPNLYFHLEDEIPSASENVY